MPNASRYLEAGYTYHLTHRCHDRRFLLNTIRERNDYRKWLREGRRRYGVSIYNYCLTSNHVHVIVHVDDPGAVSSMMQLASATVARHWNRLKEHEGSFWEHPFKCTIVQNGQHLLNCMRYVSLNMVRAGVVGHPSEWRWCGDDELTGRRSRYRLLAVERMLESLEIPSMSAFQRLYTEGIEDLLARRQFAREAAWTGALAVGDQLFVEKAAKSIGHRYRFTYSDAGTETPGTVCVHEEHSSYSAESG
ncbi:transposase [Verrucomicrobiota bacterium]